MFHFFDILPSRPVARTGIVYFAALVAGSRWSKRRRLQPFRVNLTTDISFHERPEPVHINHVEVHPPPPPPLGYQKGTSVPVPFFQRVRVLHGFYKELTLLLKKKMGKNGKKQSEQFEQVVSIFCAMASRSFSCIFFVGLFHNVITFCRDACCRLYLFSPFFADPRTDQNHGSCPRHFTFPTAGASHYERPLNFEGTTTVRQHGNPEQK